MQVSWARRVTVTSLHMTFTPYSQQPPLVSVLQRGYTILYQNIFCLHKKCLIVVLVSRVALSASRKQTIL